MEERIQVSDQARQQQLQLGSEAVRRIIAFEADTQRSITAACAGVAATPVSTTGGYGLVDTRVQGKPTVFSGGDGSRRSW